MGRYGETIHHIQLQRGYIKHIDMIIVGSVCIDTKYGFRIGE